jgi:hypothetical protein
MHKDRESETHGYKGAEGGTEEEGDQRDRQREIKGKRDWRVRLVTRKDAPTSRDTRRATEDGRDREIKKDKREADLL